MPEKRSQKKNSVDPREGRAPLITVLITTHNYGRFVGEAIDSVISQDLPPDQVEILVVDDGSTDDTSERVKKYGSRIRYLYQPNGGQASALNLGIANASGEIISLLDADDLFLPGKLARISEAFGDDPALGMVYHRLQQRDIQTDERHDYKFVSISGDLRTTPAQLLLYDPQPTSAISFRKTSILPLLPIPEAIRMLADAYLIDLVPLLSPILAIPETLAVYRIHGGNSFYTEELAMPVALRKRRLPMWRAVFHAMRKWLSGNGYSKSQPYVRAFLDRWSLRLQEEEFLIDPPTRLRFFLFLLQQNHAYRGLNAWALTAFNYLYSPAALLLGYGKVDRFYKWRGTAMKFLGRVARVFLPARTDSGPNGIA